MSNLYSAEERLQDARKLSNLLTALDELADKAEDVMAVPAVTTILDAADIVCNTRFGPQRAEEFCSREELQRIMNMLAENPQANPEEIVNLVLHDPTSQEN